MKQNAIAQYKHVCEMCENPKGADSLERNEVQAKAKKTKADLENHFKTAPKYKNDPEIQALLGQPEVKEEKKDGKKSKR